MLRYSKAGTTGGKGNMGMFIERDSNICAAGLPCLDQNSIKNILPCYSLQDQVDALLSDTIYPDSTFDHMRITKHKEKRDMRNAGFFTEGAELINPPMKTKFQTLVSDFKDTIYSSYWKRQVGKVPDSTNNLPEGLNIYTTTMGKKYPSSSNAYEVAFPKKPVSGQTPVTKECGYRTTRNYCSFNPNKTFGQPTNVDASSRQVQCCLTDDRISLGLNLKHPICSKHADFLEKNNSRLGLSLSPNNNVNCVPKGFAFGKVEVLDDIGVPECLTTCEVNPDKKLILKCLEHLNTLRKCMSKRFDGNFFPKFTLHLRYLDISKTGWLPKNILYDECKLKYIRFNPDLIEPLLSIWNMMKSSQIKYKSFIGLLNYREPTPDLPKITGIPEECLDFRTTYSEMIKDIIQPNFSLMAGVPSGKYFDKDFPVTPEGCCKADRSYLPEESDAKSCLNPSIFTVMGISHRDMYAKRDPKVVRQVFEKAGEIFTDDLYNTVWNKAKEYHSSGWVSYETFRRALREYTNKSEK
ncbi:unnamed protein product [Colias eurytheme]|nr:unnamed protein product [Colias eurytheme]